MTEILSMGSIAMCTALMIRGGQLSERDADAAERIVRSGQRMTRMISQLLDLTRARLGGGLPIEMREVDLRDVCRQVIEELPVAIALDVEGDVTGYWDPDRLAEVLSNLAGNAIEYSPRRRSSCIVRAASVALHVASCTRLKCLRNAGDAHFAQRLRQSAGWNPRCRASLTHSRRPRCCSDSKGDRPSTSQRSACGNRSEIKRHHGQNHRYRPRHDEQRRGHHGGA